MDEDFSKYKDIIQKMEATPKVPAPKHFTETVMSRLPAEERLSVWRLMCQSFAATSEISWARFSRECAQGRNACLYFLITGLFFFFIGSILFSSFFYIGSVSRAMGGFLLIQSILILIAAISLVATGLIMAADLPGATRWAKRAIMLFGFLIVANAMFINTTVKTMPGGVLALTFGIAGIVTGMILMKALDTQKQGKIFIFTGGLHNA